MVAIDLNQSMQEVADPAGYGLPVGGGGGVGSGGRGRTSVHHRHVGSLVYVCACSASLQVLLSGPY